MQRRPGNLFVQDWLINNSFNYEKLQADYGITANFHESDDRVILNYSQIDSPKGSPIVCECRGLVLNRHNGNIIAKAFDRFYNYGEMHTEKHFDFNGCTATHKEDGSIILLYYYNGEWRINTRNSYGMGYVVDGVMTWKELFIKALPEGFDWQKLHIPKTYVLELCSRYNKIVRDYPEPTVSLLSIFNNGVEYPEGYIDREAEYLGLQRPKSVVCKNILETTAYVGNLAQTDATFEGLVLRAVDGSRVKVKSQAYVALHRLCNNHALTPERVFDIVSTGEISEMVTYFPEFADVFHRGLELYNTIVSDGRKLYEDNCHLETQKEFAMKVKDSPYASVAFALRKYGSIEPDNVKKLFEKNFKLEN
jgi:hypothetical protein